MSRGGGAGSPGKLHVFRVRPKEELLTEVGRYCRHNAITSGVVVGIIGSLERATLNFLKELPGNYISQEFGGPLEIVAAQGSVALKGDELIVHIHLQLSDEKTSRGGHLVSGTVFSTAEVAIWELDYQLERQLDEYTGLNELV